MSRLLCNDSYMNTRCTDCQMPNLFCICPDTALPIDAREANAGEVAR